jgi:hypothetical protein
VEYWQIANERETEYDRERNTDRWRERETASQKEP